MPATKTRRKVFRVDAPNGQMVLWNGECFLLGYVPPGGGGRMHYQGLHMDLRGKNGPPLRTPLAILLLKLRAAGIRPSRFDRRMAGGGNKMRRP